MKSLSTLLVATLAGVGMVQAAVEPRPTQPPVAKRQLPGVNLSDITDAAGVASISSALEGQFSSLYSAQPQLSSMLAQAQSSAESYLSLANGLATNTNSAEVSSRASELYSSVLSDLSKGASSATGTRMPATNAASSSTAAAAATRSGDSSSNAARHVWEVKPLLAALGAFAAGAGMVFAL